MCLHSVSPKTFAKISSKFFGQSDIISGNVATNKVMENSTFGKPKVVHLFQNKINETHFIKKEILLPHLTF